MLIIYIPKQKVQISSPKQNWTINFAFSPFFFTFVSNYENIQINHIGPYHTCSRGLRQVRIDR